MDNARQEEFQNPTDALAATMERVQRGLLARGYRYLDGNAESWPLSAVLMVKEDTFLLVSPWPHGGHLLEAWANLRGKTVIAGLLLVGMVAPDDPMLEHALRAAGGTIAYLQAATGQLWVRHGAGTPEDMCETNLREVLSGVPVSAPEELREEALGALFSGSAQIEQIDAAAELRADLERRQAGQAASKPQPYVTLGFMAVCIAIFLAIALGSGQFNLNITEEAARRWALVPAMVHAGEWWRLFSSGFLHANVMHIGFNMFALYSLGSVLEHWQGRARVAALFLFSVLTSALAAQWFNPEKVTLGASGGVFGLFGGFIVIALLYWKDYPEQTRKQLFGWIPRMLLINGVISLLPGISLAGHVGGLIGGMLIGLIIMRSPVRRNPLPGWAWPALVALLAGTVMVAKYILDFGF